jgi:signal transduction histidine kinase
MQSGLDGEGIMLRLDLADCRPVAVNASQLGFVVHELLLNARHALLGQPKREIEVSTGESGDSAFVKVSDTGIGIAREKLSSVFTPFFSEKGEHAVMGSPQSRVKGVGLSLAVSHSVVAGAGGRIELESESGQGTTFTVWLPCAASPTGESGSCLTAGGDLAVPRVREEPRP